MSTLVDAAFGDQPGRWPLPGPQTLGERWLRAVAAGGQGRYASALADLDAIHRTRAGGRLESLACSTRASFLRQLGWHAAARDWDGRALAAADDEADAVADAVTGLAADALGIGRFALADRLLSRTDEIDFATTDARLPVRTAWVRAELSMMTGRGAVAVEHAERAVALAGDLGSARHSVKSDVVLAAALCSVGSPDRARRVADAALASTERHGLVPLRWALACLLGDIGSATRSADAIAALRTTCVAEIGARGGVWAQRGYGGRPPNH